MDLSPSSLSAILLLSGLLGYFLVTHLIRYISRSDPNSNLHFKANLPIHLPKHNESYIIVEAGGNIVYSNTGVKELLNLNGEKINLELLAAEMQPKESLFALCAKEGKARFKLGDELIEGKSYLLPGKPPLQCWCLFVKSLIEPALLTHPIQHSNTMFHPINFQASMSRTLSQLPRE